MKTHGQRASDYLFLTAGEAERLAKKMPPTAALSDLAELFKIFGDPTRIRLLYALSEAELCVGDLALLLVLSQTAVSHQLRVLRAHKLVRTRREGKAVFYALADDHVRSILNQGWEHIGE